MTLIRLTKGDITRIEADAIVNAANSRLAGGGGVDGAIHRAGGPSIADQCREWINTHGTLPTGQAMVTTAGDLPARFVIHTVGPVWASHDEETARRLLAACYSKSLELAAEKGCASVSFPNISTGIYGYPKEKAASTAVSAVREWQGDVVEEVIFVCFDEENRDFYADLLEP